MRIEIPKEFLKEEVRNGFTVSGTMKRCWAVQLKLLSLIDDVCRRYGLRWFVDYGTLLGAVRHKGYIPWDDDIDIAMLREDYETLFSVLPDELPFGAEVMRFGSPSNLWRGWSNVNNRKNIDTGDDPDEAALTGLWCGSPYVDGIDIYPLDYIPKDKDRREDMFTVYEDLMIALRGYPKDSNTVQQRDLCVMAEDIARSCSREDAIGVGNVTNLAHYKQPWRDISWYDNPVKLPFEMIEVNAPSGYRDLLKDTYGPEWETPKQAKCGHEYPFYAKQEQWIEDYHVSQAVSEVESVFVSDGARVAHKRVLSCLRQFPRRYELYYTAARVVADMDKGLTLDYLRRAAELCQDENREMIIEQIENAKNS